METSGDQNNLGIQTKCCQTPGHDCLGRSLTFFIFDLLRPIAAKPNIVIQYSLLDGT